MDFLVFLAILAVIVAVAIVVGAPLRESRRATGEDRKRERLDVLEARKETRYREIRDAEIDYRTGKLAEDDYRELDRALRREAITVLNEIDEIRASLDGDTER